MDPGAGSAGCAPGGAPRGAARARGALLRLIGIALLGLLLAAGASPSGWTIREQPNASTAISSPNWAGYAAHRSGIQFSDVRGNWVQPAVTCPTGGTYSSFWIGLDGYLSDDVEQVGTAADCVQAKVAAYYAWYELYPEPRVRIAMVIRPGDHLEADVNSVPGGTTVDLRDVTSGRVFNSVRHGASGPLSSAEWIAEAPSACSQSSCYVLPLANFGSVGFSGCSAVGAGSSGTINAPAWTNDVITMVGSNGSIIAQPSGVTADGASFVVSRR